MTSMAHQEYRVVAAEGERKDEGAWTSDFESVKGAAEWSRECDGPFYDEVWIEIRYISAPVRYDGHRTKRS